MDSILSLDSSLALIGCYWLRQVCTNYVLGKEPIVHIPPHIRTLQNKVLAKAKTNNISNKELLYGNLKELSDSFEISQRMVSSVQSAIKSKSVVYLDEQLNNSIGDDSSRQQSFVDILVDGHDPSSNINNVSDQQDKDLDSNKLLTAATNAFLSLSERERTILLLRYNIIGDNNNEQK